MVEGDFQLARQLVVDKRGSLSVFIGNLQLTIFFSLLLFGQIKAVNRRAELSEKLSEMTSCGPIVRINLLC